MIEIIDVNDSRAVRNKNNVLALYDLMINKKKSEEGMAKYLSPDYIQHNPLIPDGREALFEYVGSLPSSTRFEYRLAVAEGDFVMVHGRYSDNGHPAPWIVVDILRLENGIMVEHWDVIQDEAKRSASGHSMFSGRV